MNPKTEDFKSAIAAVREQIATAKRGGTRGGFIGYHGCMSVTRDFVGILSDAWKAADNGEYAFAYSVAALILINLAKLASTADDSAGGITDARGYVEKVLEKSCVGAEYGSKEAEYIYLQSIKDSRNKAFDGWEEFSYDILMKTARLATDSNKDKMYTAAEALYEKIKKDAYSSWADERNALIRLEIKKATESEADVSAFIKENLEHDAIRKIAVNKAIADEDYSYAEVLCSEKLTQNEKINVYLSRPSEWRYFLYEIYDKSGESEKKIKTAEDLLFRFDIKYYAVLKQLLIEKGIWESRYQSLLTELENRLPYHLFMKILSDEGENQLLLDEVRKHPTSVFDYGRQLAESFASETYAVCTDVILSQATEADNRIKYKKVCGLIKELCNIGGMKEAEDIMSELKMKFPRRPAMLDELDAVSRKLTKNRK